MRTDSITAMVKSFLACLGQVARRSYRAERPRCAMEMSVTSDVTCLSRNESIAPVVDVQTARSLRLGSFRAAPSSRPGRAPQLIPRLPRFIPIEPTPTLTVSGRTLTFSR